MSNPAHALAPNLRSRRLTSDASMLGNVYCCVLLWLALEITNRTIVLVKPELYMKFFISCYREP